MGDRKINGHTHTFIGKKMKIHIELGSLVISGQIVASWPARVLGWLIFAAVGIVAVHALAASDVPDTRPTATILGAAR